MRRFGKICKWFGIAVLLLVLLLATALGVLATSKTALHWVWTAARGYLPDGIQVAQVQGRLIGPLQIRGVKVELDSMHLSLDRFAFDWAPSELLDARLHIKQIALTGLDYTALPTEQAPPEPGEPFELPDSIDLPVDVQLDGFELNNASIRTAPDAEPIIINQARLVATLAGDAWRLTEISGNGPLFRIEGGARLTPRGRYANKAQIAWRVNPPDLAPVQGKTELHGTLDELVLRQSVAAPYNLEAQATVRDVLDALRVKANVQLADTRLAAIRKDLPAVILDTRATVEGALDNLQFNVNASAAEPTQGTANIELDGRYTGQAVAIKKLRLTSPDTPGQLQAHGKVALAAGNEMDLVLNWTDLQWPLAGAPEYTSKQGEFRVSGPLQDYRVDGGLGWSVAGLEQAGKLTLAGHGDLESFVLKRLALSGAPGTLNASADITWAPALEVVAQADGEHLNPGAIVPDWPGDFDLHASVAARQKDDGLYATVKQLRADGALRNQPLQLDAAAVYDPSGAVIKKLRLLAGETTLTASGQVTEPMDVKFALDSDDLGTSVPGAQGEIHAQGSAAGAYLQPQVVAQLDADGLEYAGNKVAKVALDADVDWTAARDSRLKLSASGGEFGGTTVKSLAVEADGRPRNHSIEVAVDSSQGTVDLATDGDFNQTKGLWDFTLTRARLTYPKLAPWSLVAPVDGQVSAQAQGIEQACWASGDARLCLQGSHDEKASTVQFKLDDFSYAYLASLLPETTQLTGGLSAQGSAELPAGGTPVAQLQVRTADGSLKVSTPDGEQVEVLAFEPGEVDASLAEDGALRARIDLPLGNGGLRLNAQVPAGEGTLNERPLAGEFSLKLDTLDFLEQLSPEITQIDGAIDGQMAISGTLAAPSVNGRLALNAPQLVLGTPGIDIRDLSLALLGRGREVGIQMRAKSGGGQLAADGTARLTDTGPNLDLALTGEAFQVLDDSNGRVFISPDIKVAVTDTRIDVNGDLRIPKANITPRDLPAAGGVTASDDQVIVRNEDEGRPQTEVGGRELHARVRVIVGDPTLRVTESARRGRNFADSVRRLPGDKVRLEAYGLKAILAGSLLVIQEPGEPATGSGELRMVVGEFKAYGQDLTIEDGQVLFGGGPVSEPALNLNAVRRPREDILVGVRVRGRLEQPRFTLYSDPAGMTQTEQLSWLVLGRPLSGASSSETSLVTKAALALGIKGGNAISDKLRGKLGVDELGIESDSSNGTEQAALVVGKYLTPKLYVSYGVGLFEPVSTLRLRYTLTRLFRIETQSSATATGGDLIYSIERGGD